MKKYMIPTIEIVKIESQPLLSASIDAVVNGSQGNENALSRGGRYDDDEEEEW
ncbi:MAG: hypothetical protein IJ804_04835 [Prevotella sp.]|nr:hypothetical protein [Prevotella sp.]